MRNIGVRGAEKVCAKSAHTETACLTQQSISVLFDEDRSTVAVHLKNIFDSGELMEPSDISILEHTRTMVGGLTK